jgi:hypothetical protein
VSKQINNNCHPFLHLDLDEKGIIQKLIPVHFQLTFDESLKHEVVVHGLSSDPSHILKFKLNEGIAP